MIRNITYSYERLNNIAIAKFGLPSRGTVPACGHRTAEAAPTIAFLADRATLQTHARNHLR
jgi:hypothetical protein